MPAPAGPRAAPAPSRPRRRRRRAAADPARGRQSIWGSILWDKVLPNFLDISEMYKAAVHHKEQIRQAAALHKEQMKASLLMHNHEVGVASKIHKTDVKLACNLHDKEREMAMGMHNVELQVELLHSSCENIRDTAEQFIAKISTFLLVETLFLGSLFVVIIEAEMPTNTQTRMPWLVILYALSTGTAMLMLATSVWLSFTVQERVIKFRRVALGGAFRAFKIHREHWTQSMEKLRDFYFRLESERENLTKSFDDDAQGAKRMVKHATLTFFLGIVSLLIGVVCVFFAKSTLGYVDENGEVHSAWTAAGLFVALFVGTIVTILFLVRQEAQTDIIRPQVTLKGDYCCVLKMNSVFLDPGAIATDKKSEGGDDELVTEEIHVYISYESQEGIALLPEFEAEDLKGRKVPKPMKATYHRPTGTAKVPTWTPRIPGMYIITYLVADDEGNEGMANRTVMVLPESAANRSPIVTPSSPFVDIDPELVRGGKEMPRPPSWGALDKADKVAHNLSSSATERPRLSMAVLKSDVMLASIPNSEGGSGKATPLDSGSDD